MADDSDFLDAIEADNKGEPVKAEEPVAEAPSPEPVIEEPAAPPAPEPVIEEAEAPKPEAQQVPITALLDERDKRKALEAELAQFRATQQPAEQVPDRWEDPEGYEAFQEQRIQTALYQQNLQWSERIATIQHGEETVSEAKKWGIERCGADPFFNAKVAASPDPVDYIVSEWKREQIASQVNPDEFKQFQAWKAAQSAIQPPPQPAAAPSRSTPPRSLASAPSAGGIMTEVAQSDEEIFGEIFGKT